MAQLDAIVEDVVRDLIAVYRKHRPRNLLRTTYFDGEAALKDFGISLPPSIAKGVTATLGWPAKGVHAVTDRSEFQGFVDAAGTSGNAGVDEILTANDFVREFAASKVSSATHGCAFIAIRPGDVAGGEPETMMYPVAADRCAAIWHRGRRALKAFLEISDVSPLGKINQAILYLPDAVFLLRGLGGAWDAGFDATPLDVPELGTVTVVPMPYQYELSRPLGHSRITRASMGFVDSAIRTIVRSEVSSEFYSAPQFWLFGAKVEQFVGTDRWSALMGRVKALNVEDGEDKPDLQRFTGESPQPHINQLRMWASLFADDQDLDVKFADASNPSSADAIFAAKETLITTTREANRGWGRAGVQAVKLAVATAGTGSPEEVAGLSAQFTDPAIVSPSARADAFSKLASNIDGFGTSEVGMEYAGLTREQITRFKAEQRANAATDRIAQLLAVARAGVTDSANSG